MSSLLNPANQPSGWVAVVWGDDRDWEQLDEHLLGVGYVDRQGFGSVHTILDMRSVVEVPRAG
jgi:hypothetical protein